MNHINLSATIGVGMRISFGRRAVRGPTCVADAGFSLDGRAAQRRNEVFQFAHSAPHFDGVGAAVVGATGDGDARRIVAAIFQFAQPRRQNRRGLPSANVSNNSTHDDLVTQVAANRGE